MISKGFFESLELVANDRGLAIEDVLAKVEMAMGVACRENYSGDIKLDVDFEKKRIRVFEYKYVVEEFTEGAKGEISVEEAQILKPKGKVKPGMEFKTEIDFSKISRKAAAKFKNTFGNELKNLEREEAFNFFNDKVGELITATVNDVNPNFVTFVVGKNTFASMPLSEGIPGEEYVPGEQKKVYINKVEKTTKGPKIYLCRNNKEIVKRLFELTIPEISDGTIEIMGISRDPGSRTKIGVLATKPNLDPKGACVGQGGLRIKAINEALNNEKIDIFTWKNDPIDLVAEALLPARSLSVIIEDPKAKKATVIVRDDQFSLAIGRAGQNVRLASFAIDWRIDIKRFSDALKEGIDFKYNVIQK